MTLDQALTTMAEGLAKQRARSLLYDGTSCQYRGEGGNKCAIGMVIPDELYDPGMERKSGSLLLTTGAEGAWPGLTHEMIGWFKGMNLTNDQIGKILDAIQSFHDTEPCQGGTYGYTLQLHADKSDEELATIIKAMLEDRVAALVKEFTK